VSSGLDTVPEGPEKSCPHCSRPMQLADTVRDASGFITAYHYICGCPPVGVYHLTVHTGDKTHEG
jgi:hypothetical protein